MQSAIMNDDVDFNYPQNNIMSQNLDHMKKACDSGFENAIIKNVADFYIQIYIFFKGSSFNNTGAREKMLRLSKHMTCNCTYKLFIVG